LSVLSLRVGQKLFILSVLFLRVSKAKNTLWVGNPRVWNQHAESPFSLTPS
jgi:hypothetical protein